MIDLLPSPDQADVVDAIGGFLKDQLPLERLREGGRTEADDGLWRDLAGLGCFGLSQPEAAGGIGLGLAEEALAFREYGRQLLSPAVLGTVLAARIASTAGRTELASALVAGERRAGVGHRTGGGLQLFDARPGDLVTVWDEAGAAVFEVDALGPIEPRPCFDGALSLGVAKSPSPSPVATVDGPDTGLAAAVLIAALLVGATEAARDAAVEYAKTRNQFGQPIGAFQAVKHKCADMALGAEAGWAQTAYAAVSLVAGAPDGPFQAWTAKAVAGSAALEAARTSIQIHGGMGFTADVAAHHVLKRAHVLNELGGALRDLGPRLMTLPTAA